jgi:hypothetical protein
MKFEKKDISKNNNFLIEKLTTLWALSEATLGGVLHAFKIPLTGILINGSAIIFIALIALYTQKKGFILKATIIVLMVKATVSPHTPIMAYLSVSLQGIIGELIFYNKKYFKISVVVFGLITLFLSGIQRIIVLTLLFGNSLWESIDLFSEYALLQVPFFDIKHNTFNISDLIIYIYVGLHLVVGLTIGVFVGKLPQMINDLSNSNEFNTLHFSGENKNLNLKKRKRKYWLKKPSAIAVILLVTMIFILTYIYPQFSESAALRALIMIIRSIFIMMIWFKYLGPFLMNKYKKYLLNKGNKYANEFNDTMNYLPYVKSTVIESWRGSKKYNAINRLKYFVLLTLINLDNIELVENENITI